MIKTSTIYRALFVIPICFLSLSVLTYTSNPPPGYAGDPGSSNCTSCHSGSVITSGTAWNSIALTGLPVNGYVPGSTYSLTLSGNSAATSKNGFQLTVLNSSNSMTGSLTAGSGTSLQTNSGRTYISQNGSNGSSWTFSWTAPLTGTGTVTFYAAFNGSNANSSDVGDAIYTKTFALAQASTNIPTAVISPSSTTICLGDTLYLAGSGINNPTTFNWQFLNNSPNSASGQNVFVVYTTAGLKTIRLTTSNADGTSPVTGINITVVAKPTATITAPNGLTICGSDSIILQANTGTGLQYLWTPGNFTTSSIKVADSINYRVKVTNSNGCFANSVFVKPTKSTVPQSILVSSKDTICKNDSVLFNLTGSGFTAQYFVNDSLNSQDIGFVFKRNIGGTYKITPKITKNGCSNTLQNKFITIQEQAAAPIVLCGNSTTSSMQFTWSAVSGYANYEISTNNGNNWIDVNGVNQLSHTVTGLLPNSTVNIWVRAKAIGPCGAGIAASKSCVNNGCTPINITYAFNPKVCINNSVTSQQTNFELTNITNPKYLVQFEFDTIVNLYSRNTLFTFAAKLGNNQIRIKVKDSSDNVCPIVDSAFTIKGNASPMYPNLVPDKFSHSYCKGEDIVVRTAKGFNSHLYHFYQIIPERKLLVTTSDNMTNLKNLLTGIPTNTVKAIVIDTVTLCADSSSEVTLTENIKPKADFSFEYFKSDSNNVNKNRVVFTNLSTDLDSSLWLFGDLNNSTSILKNTTFTYTIGGNYQAKLIAKTNANCIDTITKRIVITNTSVNGLFANSFIKIYPNPAFDLLTVSLNEVNDNGVITVLDLSGKQVYQAALSKLQIIPINDLNAGVYLVKIETNNTIYYSKFVKK